MRKGHVVVCFTPAQARALIEAGRSGRTAIESGHSRPTLRALDAALDELSEATNESEKR